MNAHSDEFRRCLIDLDVQAMRKLWLLLYPHQEQPGSDEEVLTTMHLARTHASSLTLKQRAYSHCWLVERGYPSQLPETLKPRAEQMFPRVLTAVGVSVNFRAVELKPAGKLIERAMADAVEHLYADGEERPEIVRKAMFEAGTKERGKLLGRRE